MILKLSYPIKTRDGKKIKQKIVRFPKGSKSFFIDKVRTGFVDITYLPEKPTLKYKVGNSKFYNRLPKTISLPKNFSGFGNQVKLIKNSRTLSKGR